MRLWGVSMSKKLNHFLLLVLFCPVAGFAYDQRGGLEDYDLGPDVNTKVGYGYAQIIAQTPNYRAIGIEALGQGKREKFRWKFGPMFYRGRLGENQVKVLVIGQEGAQDENISDRSFTGGTGGRMQNFMSALGLNKSYLFINTFVYTIKGQYADYAPMLKNGKLTYSNLLSYPMLKLAQNPRSPIVKHRHDLIDHIIESNKESLKLIIAVGGAAQDTLSTYILSKGGQCKSTVTKPESIQLVKYRSDNAGGNKSFFSPADQQNKNLFLAEDEQSFYRHQWKARSFTWGVLKGERIDFENRDIQNELKRRMRPSRSDSSFYFEQDGERVFNESLYEQYVGFQEKINHNLVQQKNGPYQNGVEDLRQLTSKISKCRVNGKGNTLKGLGSIDRDIRYIAVTHPGSISPTLRKNFTTNLGKVRKWHESQSDSNRHWNLPADTDYSGKLLEQNFDINFKYTRKPVPRRDYRFGLPSIMGEGRTSTTRRNRGGSIDFGGRPTSKVNFPNTKDTYTPSKDYQYLDLPYEPNKTNFKDFDQGPGRFWTRVFTGVDQDVPMLDENQIWSGSHQPLSDKKFGSFAIYRGTPKDSEVLILAVQHSHDDLFVGRALMGHEGQKLQAFLNGIKTNKYTILRTLPFDTLRAPEDTIQSLMNKTREHRSAIWKKLQKDSKTKVKVIFTLGKHADKEITKLTNLYGVPVISLTSGDSGYTKAFTKLLRVKEWDKQDIKLQTHPIPIARKDIPYGMRRWTGTSGDRVARASGKFFGKMYKIVAPYWATKVKATSLNSDETRALEDLGLTYTENR